MLEQVALGQTRFKIPGLVSDSRGVAMGGRAAVPLPTIERVVSFLRIFLQDSVLEDLGEALEIVQIKGPSGAREFMVLAAPTSSWVLDRMSRAATLLSATAFTGAGKHMVRYRDARSPLGYDARELSRLEGDFLLYSEATVRTCQRVGRLEARQLMFRLGLERLPRARATGSTQAAEELWLRVRGGLRDVVLGYLWRSGIAAQVADLEAVETGGFSSETGPRPALVRVPGLPARVRELMCRTPGVEVYRAASPRTLVEVDYRHPLPIERCASWLGSEGFFVFSGTRGTVDVLAEPPPLVDAGLLVESAALEIRQTGDLDALPARVASRAAALRIPLHLARRSGGELRPGAVLVPWEAVEQLTALVRILPAPLLAGTRVAMLDRGLLLAAGTGVGIIPIGQAYEQLAPSVFVPLGYELVPRVGGEVLTAHLGATPERLVFFFDAPTGPDGAGASPPVAVRQHLFQPLAPETLAPLAVAELAEARQTAAKPEPAVVVNDDLATFPLWGLWSSR